MALLAGQAQITEACLSVCIQKNIARLDVSVQDLCVCVLQGQGYTQLMRCSVVQCHAERCGLLQGIAEHCRALQGVARGCNGVRCVISHTWGLCVVGSGVCR